MEEQLTHPEIVDVGATIEPAPDVDMYSKVGKLIVDHELTFDQLAAVMRVHYTKRREELLAAVRDIEDLLGFIEVEGDLAVRVSKLQRFTGTGG